MIAQTVAVQGLRVRLGETAKMKSKTELNKPMTLLNPHPKTLLRRSGFSPTSRLGLFNACLVLLALVVLTSLPGGAWAKPLPPMSVGITSPYAPVAGAVFNFTVVVRPRTNLERVEVSVELPAGVSLLTGEITQVIQASAGKPLAIEYAVQLPTNLTGAIIAQARVGSAAEVLYSVSSRYELNASRRKAQSVGPPAAPFKRGVRDGQPVREYSLP